MPGCGHGRTCGAQRSELELNAVEVSALADFAKEHAGCGGSGGHPSRMRLSGTETGIGLSLKARCLGCGAEADVSDLDCW